MLARQGAVDELVALQMARGALRELGSDRLGGGHGHRRTDGRRARQAGGHGVDRLRHGQKDPMLACHHFEGGREAVRLQTVLIALRTMEEALASF